MKQNDPPKQKIFFVLMLFALLLGGITKAQAQNPSGISLSWNIGVGCQSYSEDRKEIFLEQIGQSECINVCNGSNVIYTLAGLPVGSSTVWTVNGGVKSIETNTSVTVNWTGIGGAGISFAITTPSGILSRDVCVEILQGPAASFTSIPFGVEEDIKACSNQLIYFTDTSQTNGGTDIVNYYWDFGDGSTSDAQNPSHSYSEPGTYTVTLTVTNSCNCSNTYLKKVIIDERGFDISCASVVCENQVVTYSLPEEATNSCGDFIWEVIGGTIVGSNHDKTIDVRWDQVDASGFGYVTFIPDYCELPCRVSTTIRVPVIQINGTITGNTSLCLGQQGHYSLPQWPTTDIQWQIEGNVGGQLGTIVQTNQRNEIIFTPAQAGTITLTAIYNNTLVHCGGTAQLVITVKSPEPFTGETVVCLGSSSTYSTISTNPVKWTLRNDAGTIINTVNNSNTFTYLFGLAGNFTLNVSGSSLCDGQTQNIVVTPALQAPTIDTPILTVCPNAPYTYSVANPDANSEYEWQIDNGTITGSTTAAEVNVSFQGNGQIRVRRVQISPVGCSSPFAVQNVEIVSVNADISNTTSVVSQISACSNNYFTYNAVNTSGGIYNDSASTYEWSVSPSSAGSITLGQGTPTVEVIWNNEITAPVNLVLIIRKCTVVETITKQITVTPIPTISISSDATVCSGKPITFTLISNVPLATGTTINWNFGNGLSYDTTGIFTTSQTFNNGTASNIGYTVVATIVNANNCVGTITAASNFVVTPGPNALASNSTTINTFCYDYEISASLTASTTNNATVVWYRGTTATQVGTGPILNVTPTMGFGTYFFIATLNGCKTQSNNLFIMQDCGPQPPCTISPAPTLAFTAINDCGKITLTGTASGSPTSIRFSILGPEISLLNVSGNSGANTYIINQANAGVYSVFYKVTYLGTNGSPCTITKSATVTVPYVADFKTNATCAGDSVYTVQLTDNSNFLGTVTGRQYKYERATNPNGPWTLLANWSSNQNYTVANLNPGNYYFRQSIKGSIGSTPQAICTKTQMINLTSMNGLAIAFEQPPCFDTAVKFSVPTTSSFNGDTYLWSFETVAGVLVTNTNPTPTRVFNSSSAGAAPVNVTVKVINKFGCIKTLSVPVTIPARCFSGTIGTTPANGIACKGSALQMSYIPGNLLGECTPTSYIWLKNNQPIPNATSSTYLAYTSGFYTVLVSNGSCYYSPPIVITPVFTPLPSLILNGPTALCKGDMASFSVTTDAPIIRWTVNGVLNTSFNDQQSISIPNLPLGSHTVSVQVTNNGCEKTAAQTIVVQAAPASVMIYPPQMQDCQSYTIQLTAFANGAGTYNWSNGATGSSITVTEGGPYMVTFTNAGGCSTSAQIVVPKSPKAYMWVFPEGCYSKCKDETAYLLGPTLFVNNWSWLLDQNTLSSGVNSIPANLPVHSSGTYNLKLNTGMCDFQSPSMYMSAAVCPDCELSVRVKDIYSNGEGLCSYTLLLSIENNTGVNMQASVISNNNNAMLTPGSITILPNNNDYTFTVIPINGFTGGSIMMSLIGSIEIDREFVTCSTLFSLDVPNCNPNQGRPETAALEELLPLGSNGNIILYPNPAHDKVNIRFETDAPTSQVEIYDLMGRLISSFESTTTQGVIDLDLAPMARGVYVVVLRQGSQILMQRKLQVY